MGSYVPGTDREQLEMLQTIGLSSLDDLYVDVPEELKLKNGLNLPAGKSEIEVRRSISELAGANKVYGTIFRGAGAYRHYIPSIVKSVVTKENLVTAYTPYQAGGYACLSSFLQCSPNTLWRRTLPGLSFLLPVDWHITA